MISEAAWSRARAGEVWPDETLEQAAARIDRQIMDDSSQEHDEAQEFAGRMRAEVHDIAALLWDDPEIALEHIPQARDLLDVAEDMAVQQMRRRGARWQQVADALGVSRQAAWERFRHHG